MTRLFSLKYLKIAIATSAILVLLAILFSYLCNWWLIRSAVADSYTKTQNIPSNNVGLLLGTRKILASGRENQYFRYRIQAATDLYKQGKIKHILVSGDNHTKGYNEPEDIQASLIEAGIPVEAITLDFAGFRTLDSVVRCKKVFGQNQFTIISQRFHNERALFIARCYGLDAIAFNARDVGHIYGRKTRLREYFAKVKAVLDIYILRKKPKFLGEKIKIAIK